MPLPTPGAPNSTIFLLPIFGLPKKEYDKAGFVNAYIGYEGRHYGGPTLFLVFYAKERYADHLDDIMTMMESKMFIRAFNLTRQISFTDLNQIKLFLNTRTLLFPRSVMEGITKVTTKLTCGMPK